MFPRLQSNLLFALLFLAASILAPQASSKTSFIPHISQGGGWSTAFHVINLCSTTSAYTVDFYDSAGDTLHLYSDGEWRGFGDEELPARKMQFAYFADEGEERSGYAIVENDDGYVAVEVFHVQHYPDDTTWYVITQAQPLSGAKSGVIVPFLNFEGCDSNIVIASDAPGAATMEVFNTSGESLGDVKYIGNLFHLHENFMLSEWFPAARGEFGTVRINGNVSAVGLAMCDGNLQFSRLARPMPSSQPGNPEASPPQYEVLSFDINRVRGTPLAVGVGAEVFSYRLVVRNPTSETRQYTATLEFLEGEILLDTAVIPQSPFSIVAGGTRTLSGTVGDPGKRQRLLGVQGVTQARVTIDVVR